MSVAAREANSTRELRKISKEEQKEVKKRNAGNHNKNAGGYALDKKGKDETDKKISTASSAQMEGARKPAPLRPSRNRGRRPTSNYNRNEEHQPPAFALEQGGQTHPNKRQRFHEPTPSAAYASPNSYLAAPHWEVPFPFDNTPTEVQSRPTPNAQSMSTGFGNLATPTYSANSVSARMFPNLEGLLESEGGPNTNYGLENPYHGFQRQLGPFNHVEEAFFSTSQHIVNNLASEASFAEIPPPVETDYRNVEPRTEIDMENIQEALWITRNHCEFKIDSLGGATTRYQSYLYQLEELRESFAALWISAWRPLPVPTLAHCFMPWRNGFNDWRVYVTPYSEQNGRVNYEGPR